MIDFMVDDTYNKTRAKMIVTNSAQTADAVNHTNSAYDTNEF